MHKYTLLIARLSGLKEGRLHKYSLLIALTGILTALQSSSKLAYRLHVTYPHPRFSEPYILGGQPTDDRIYVESRIERAPDYTEDRIEEWRVSEIIISAVERQDDGLYECKAHNEGGQFFKSGHVQVRVS